MYMNEYICQTVNIYVYTYVYVYICIYIYYIYGGLIEYIFQKVAAYEQFVLVFVYKQRKTR